jgi:hypothetical protein
MFEEKFFILTLCTMFLPNVFQDMLSSLADDTVKFSRRKFSSLADDSPFICVSLAERPHDNFTF